MRKIIDLWITDCITGTIEVVHDIFDERYYYSNDLFSRLFCMHLMPYFDKQRAVKLEFISK